jgi:hypothetical protein
MHLFRREQWEAGPQIETRLRTEDGVGTGAGAVALEFTLVEDQAEELVVFLHGKN